MFWRLKSKSVTVRDIMKILNKCPPSVILYLKELPLFVWRLLQLGVPAPLYTGGAGLFTPCFYKGDNRDDNFSKLIRSAKVIITIITFPGSDQSAKRQFQEQYTKIFLEKTALLLSFNLPEGLHERNFPGFCPIVPGMRYNSGIAKLR
ncbi:MAG: hypothetical protein LBT22_04795 [Peptococcaceae bacterium]|nr:hypothetical protein [Peptococcaceae bacterium]